MAVRSTRSKRPLAAQEEPTSGEPQSSKQETLVPDEYPPYVLILPQNASSESRVITVDTSGAKGSKVSQRYFVDPQKGFYEFTTVSKPAKACGSWLLSPDMERGSDTDGAEGHVISSPDLLIATPIDAVFVVLAIPGVLESKDPARKEFDTLENRMWTLRNKAPQLAEILTNSSRSDQLNELLEKAIRSVCRMEVINGEDVGYSFDEEQLALMMLKRADTAAVHGLSASLEERFVTQPLQMPEMSIRREDSGVSIAKDLDEDPEAGGTKSNLPVSEADAAVRFLLRVRVAFEFMAARYVPSRIRASMHHILKQGKTGFPDFAPLDHQLELIAKAKAEAQALRSISDNISRKRGADDEEALEKLEAKRRKKEEEEQKKKQMSQGVKKLLKADTSGMKKLSSFFQKK